MKIAIDVTQAIYGTGVSQYTRHLVSELLKLKTKDSLILFGGSLRRKAELDHWIRHQSGAIGKTHRLSPKMAHFLWNTLHLYPVERITGPVDVIHTSDWAEPPARAPKVTTIHDLAMFKDPQYVHPEVGRVHHKRLFWVIKESARIIAVSHATKSDIVRYLEVDPERIDVIPEAPTLPPPTLNTQEIVTNQFRRLGITKPYILIPGSGHPRKNIHKAVAAFKRAKLDLLLVIVGRPSEDEAKLASPSVIFTGFVSDLDMGLLTSQAQVVLFPSLYEGFGLPVLDAFAASVPVVTSDTSSLPEVAGPAAVLVNPLSEESIADGIIEGLENRSELIRKGHQQLKKFSWQKTARMTLKLYQEVAQNHQ